MFDVIIAGGGPAGCSTAAALSELGLSILLADAGVDRSRQLAGELLHPTGVDDLRALGLGAVISDAHTRSVRGFAVIDADGAATRTALLPYATGDRGVTFEHAAFVGALFEAVAARPGITVVRARVTEVRANDAEGVEVVLSEGDSTRVERARLLVAADGRGSHTRKLLGIPDHHRRMSTMLGLAVDSRLLPHPEHGHLFIGGAAPVLAYEIEPGVARVLVDLPLGSRPDRAREPEVLRGLPEALREGVLHSLSSRTPRMASNDTRLPQTITLGSAVLVGDAAACAHPLSASGITYSTRDARILQQALKTSGLDVRKALDLFVRLRRPAQRTRLSLASALYRAFSDRAPEMQALRAGLFDYWNKSADGGRRSMSLLAARETRMWSLAREYARVVGYGVGSLVAEGLRPDGAEVSDLFGAAAGLVASAWPHVRSAVRGQVEVGGQLLHLPRRPLPNPERTLEEHSGPARASNS